MNKKESLSNILSFDVEEWSDNFHLKDEERGGRSLKGSRITLCLQKILAMLKSNNARATFFIVGRIAENNPDIVEMIVADGHEIASHGYFHKPLYLMTPTEFKEDLLRSIRVIKVISRQEIIGYRAPGYTITKKNLWALDIINECGLLYDSSIYPVSLSLFTSGGVAGYPQGPFCFENGLKEFPLATVSIFGLKIPIATTTYFRLFPYFITQKAIELLNKKSLPATLNLHTWEFDPEIPRVKLPFPHNIKRYYNLSETEGRFKELLKDFKLISCKEAVLNLHYV